MDCFLVKGGGVICVRLLFSFTRVHAKVCVFLGGEGKCWMWVCGVSFLYWVFFCVAKGDAGIMNVRVWFVRRRLIPARWQATMAR